MRYITLAAAVIWFINFGLTSEGWHLALAVLFGVLFAAQEWSRGRQ